MNDAPLDRLLEKFGVWERHGKEFRVHCPAHQDEHPSLDIRVGDTGKILLICRRGCATENILKAIGLSYKDLNLQTSPLVSTSSHRLPSRKSPAPVRSLRWQDPRKGIDWGEPVAIYDYHTAEGDLRLKVLRYERWQDGKKLKHFRQASPGPQGGLLWTAGDAPLCLYRLPQVAQAVKNGQTIYLVEGEKDADNLHALGLVATCNPMGAVSGAGKNKWRAEFTQQLRGADVVILPDNDPSGSEHARNVARALQGVACRLRVLELPGLPEKGDVSDWLEAGGTRGALLQLTEAASEWEPPRELFDRGATEAAADNLPCVETNRRHLRDVSQEALAAMIAANDPPSVFVQSRRLVRIRTDTGGGPSIETMSEAALCGRLARSANFISTSDRRGSVPVAPAERVVRDILAMPAWPGVPPLDGLVTAPIVAPDGSLVTAPGYLPGAHVYYHDADGLSIPDTTPAPEKVEAAKALLLDDLLGDFPFVPDAVPAAVLPDGEEPSVSASRAHALALLLLPFVRLLIQGPTPLHLVDAPTPGSGKTLLVEVITGIFTPGGATISTAPTEEEEWRKRITCELAYGRAFVFFDNIKRRLSSSSLAAVLTSLEWQDRLMGRNDALLRLPNRSVWVGTANNVQMEDEQVRRTVWIRIDPRLEKPEEREGFRIANIRRWTREHRSELVGAALTLVRAWLAAGRPLWRGKLLGSYESWCLVMGGILDAIGVPGFLQNRSELYERLDPERGRWAGFLERWHQRHGVEKVRAADVLQIAAEHEIVEAGDGAAKVFGKVLRSHIDRVYDGRRVEFAGTVQRVARYRVRECVSSVSGVSLSPIGGKYSARTQSSDSDTNPLTEEIDTPDTLDTHPVAFAEPGYPPVHTSDLSDPFAEEDV